MTQKQRSQSNENSRQSSRPDRANPMSNVADIGSKFGKKTKAPKRNSKSQSSSTSHKAMVMAGKSKPFAILASLIAAGFFARRLFQHRT